MYKIYINETPLLLATTSDWQTADHTDATVLYARYTGKKSTLFHYIDMLEKNPKHRAVMLYSHNIETLKNDFFSIYNVVPAGGGVVLNDRQEILLIYRLHHWDLPKGKIDPHETPDQAALREVKEETGVQELHLLAPLLTTYHTYRNKDDKRCIKQTHWYTMYAPACTLVPQTEESIEKAVWMSVSDFYAQSLHAYHNIYDVLAAFQNS